MARCKSPYIEMNENNYFTKRQLRERDVAHEEKHENFTQPARRDLEIGLERKTTVFGANHWDIIRHQELLQSSSFTSWCRESEGVHSTKGVELLIFWNEKNPHSIRRQFELSPGKLYTCSILCSIYHPRSI